MNTIEPLPSKASPPGNIATDYQFPTSTHIPGTEEIFTAISDSSKLAREKSQSLPPGSYIDPAFLDFETSEIFRKEWISLAHVSQIPNPGDFLKVDLCG